MTDNNIDPTVSQWFYESFVGSELQAELARQLGVPNDLESIARAYVAARKRSVRKVKLNKGFGKSKQ